MKGTSEQSQIAQWFVAIDDQSVGPISAVRLQEYLDAEEVTTESLVWREGMELWIPLRECTEMEALLESLKPVPPPLPAQEPAKPSTPPGDEKLMAEWGLDFQPSEPGSLMPSILPEVPSGTGRGWKVLAVLGLLVAIGAVVALVLVLGKEPPRAVVKEKIVRQTEVVYRDRPVVANSSDTEGHVDSETESDSVGKGTVRKPTRGARRAAPKGRAETAAERKKRLMAELSGKSDGIALKGGTGTSRPSSGGGSAEPDKQEGTLSQKQMGAVVAKNRGSLQLCYERAMKSGAAPIAQDLKVVFDVSVGGSGMVKSVRMTGSATRYSSLKNCLHSSVKKWMFPANKGGSRVQFPIVFTPAR